MKRNNETTLVARSDPLIMEVRKLLVQKHGATKASDASQTMRELSHLVIQLRKINADPHTQLSRYIKHYGTPGQRWSAKRRNTTICLKDWVCFEKNV